MHHITKSTSLFPQRMHSALTLNKKLEGGAEVCKSDCRPHTNISLEKASSESISIQQSLEVKQQSSMDSAVTKPNKPAAKNKKPSSGTPEPSAKRAKMLAVTCLKCFLCNKVIKTENLSKHLLFGEVNCTKCPAVFQNCQYYQSWTTEKSLGNNTCKHELQYSVDPMTSLQKHLSNQYLEKGTACRASLIDKPHHLRAYVNGMDSLKNKLPWKQAVLCFKQDSKSSNNRKALVAKEDGMRNKHSTSSNNSVNELSSKESSKDVNSIPVVHNKNLEEKVNGSTNLHLGSDNMTNEKDQTFPSSICSISCSESSPNKSTCGDIGLPNKKKKQEVKKRRKSEWLSGIAKKRNRPNSTSKRRVSYVDTPLDGFYYVVRQAIKECPNCYAKISPPDFTVNIVTFLMTAVCADCSLTIYIVHDPPDDASPRVCIVTGDEKLASVQKDVKKSPKQSTVVES